MPVINSRIGEGTKIWHPDLVNIYNAVIGCNCNIASFVEIGDGVVIGDNCRIQAFCFIPQGIEIGDNVFVGPRVTFLNDKHPPSPKPWEPLKIFVENGVAIGGGAVILPGVRLGENAFVGAGAIVTKDVPPRSTVVGNPATRLKKTVG